MIEIKSKLRRWGNSFGVVVPQRFIEGEKVKEGDEILIFMKKEEESNPLKETFGTFKFKKSTDKIMKEIDEELWKE